jgi:DNA-binding NarL/FixJ family response regulator
MVKQETVQVVVCQGYCLLRQALVDRLNQESWIDVCAVASDSEEVRNLVKLNKPHVLVINTSLKCSAGISALKQLKREFYWMAIVAVSCSSEFEDIYAEQILRAGADGFVSAQDSLDDLVQAIQTVRTGMLYTSRLTALERWERSAQEKVLEKLSLREAEVFCLTGCGYLPQRIADSINVSVKSVESFRERIRKKLGLANGSDLLYVASSYMRGAARRGSGNGKTGQKAVRELLSAKR